MNEEQILTKIITTFRRGSFSHRDEFTSAEQEIIDSLVLRGHVEAWQAVYRDEHRELYKVTPQGKLYLASDHPVIAEGR